MNRIISKEEEREDPRRDSSIYLRVQWCFHILQRTTRNPASFQSSRAKKTIVHTELILLQEFSKKYQNYKAHPMQIITRHLPATVPMYPTILHGRIRLPAYTALAGFQLILGGRNSILSSSQHPHNPYSSSQVHSYRILPGETGFISKGSSIVYLCNTKVSVFQLLILVLRIILQEY